MINADMRPYNYFTIGKIDAYGQPQIPSKDAAPEGKITMAIYSSSIGVQDNINYKDCNYIGLTTDTKVKDTYVIEFEGVRLKVLYIQPKGRLKQVYLKKI